MRGPPKPVFPNNVHADFNRTGMAGYVRTLAIGMVG
jgi:hypothetical protein